ncbi:hypothetical protein EV122DRAFT_280397 [Schizophyllum commune]
MERIPTTPPRHRRLLSTPTPVTVQPSPPRRSELPPCGIEARRRLIRAAQAGMGLTDEEDFSPEYLASWLDPDVEDATYFRMRKEEEERIQHDVERAHLAKNRARARKAAQEAEQQSLASERHSPSSNSRRDRREEGRNPHAPRRPSPLKKTMNPELERYRFPVSDSDSERSESPPPTPNFAPCPPDSPPVPEFAKARRGRMVQLPTPRNMPSHRKAASSIHRPRQSSNASIAPPSTPSSTRPRRPSAAPTTTSTHTHVSRVTVNPPSSSPKRLAPLSRFNPFMPRPRSESLSSVIEEGKVGMPEHADLHRAKPAALSPSSQRKLKRANTVQGFFSKINRQPSLLAFKTTT